MPLCFFASDLHASTKRYQRLCEQIALEQPTAVFLGGDLLTGAVEEDVLAFLLKRLRALRDDLRKQYPRIFVILGNDDPRSAEQDVLSIADEGLCEYLHGRRASFGSYVVFGYAFVPPTPFSLKDWERYDVSRFADSGCISPEEGIRTVAQDPAVSRYATIAADLDELAAGTDLSRAIWLFHAPPYASLLDRAALDDRMIDHVSLDVHVGSIAIRRFIDERGPRLTLHGHVHESPRLTGSWRDVLGPTHCLSAAHDGPELALVRFDPDDPARATRELIGLDV